MEGPSGASNSGGGFRRSRGVNWTEEETEQLLEAWSDRDVQMLLENGPHNRQAFERVSFNLAQHQMDKTPSQCREKIKKLKTIYRNLNNHGKVSRKIRGKLIHKLHQVMGGISALPSATDKSTEMSVAVNQEEEMDGAEVEEQRTNNNVLGDEFAGNNFGIPVKIITMNSGEDFLDEGDSSVSSDPESLSSSDIDHVEVTTQTPVSKSRVRSKKPSRRRKGSRSKRLSAIYVLIDKVIAAQSAANERFAALEERYLAKNDERLLLDKELEEKRIEAEARRQEAQRQHEIRLLGMMSQQMACILKSLNPLTFTRCETVATPIEISAGGIGGGAGGDPSKQDGPQVNGTTQEQVNGCGGRSNDYTTVYSTM